MYAAEPRLMTSQQGSSPSGSRWPYPHRFRPVFASPAHIRGEKPVPKIFPSWTRGWVSWPRCFSPPKEKAQAGASLRTLSLLSLVSALYLCACGPIPYETTSPVVLASLTMSSSVTPFARADPAPPSTRQVRQRSALATRVAFDTIDMLDLQ